MKKIIFSLIVFFQLVLITNLFAAEQVKPNFGEASTKMIQQAIARGDRKAIEKLFKIFPYNEILEKALTDIKEKKEESEIPDAPALETLKPTGPKKVRLLPVFKDINEARMKQNNLIIITDISEQRYEENPMTDTLGLALCQEVCPIIASGHLIYNILSRQLKPHAPSSLEKKADEVLKKIKWDNWDVYADLNAIFLFIPKEYKKKILEEYNTKEFQEEYIKKGYNIKYIEDFLLGFKINPDFYALSKFDIKKIKKISQLNELKNKNYAVSLLKSIFITAKDNAVWNIVLAGHGFYSEEIPKTLSPKSLIKASSGEKDTVIAGFFLPEFREFMQFLNNNLNVNLLYYFTCYGGDLNLVLPYLNALIDEDKELRTYGSSEKKKFKETIKPIERPNFTVVSGALSSNVALTTVRISLIDCKEGIKKGYVNYTKYFELLNKYSKQIDFKPTIFNDKELKEILAQITPSGELLERGKEFSSIPLVMFPGADQFRPIILYENIAIINNFTLQKYKLENKPLILNDKKLILIYPENITLDLILKNKKDKLPPSLLSMQSGLSITKFDHIKLQLNKQSIFLQDLEVTLYNLFSNSLFLKSHKYYYIKNLTITTTSATYTLNDLFIFPFSKNKEWQQMHILHNETNQPIVYCETNKGKFEKAKKKYDAELNNGYFKINVELLLPMKTIIPHNSFLNAIYNYFYLNPNLQAPFDFNNFSELLSIEEKNILNNADAAYKKETENKSK